MTVPSEKHRAIMAPSKRAKKAHSDDDKRGARERERKEDDERENVMGKY